MKIYSLKAKQDLPIIIGKTLEFLSDPDQLKTITPTSMKLVQFIIAQKVKSIVYNFLVLKQ